MLAELNAKLAAYFEITEMPANDWQKLDAAMHQPDGIRLGFFGPGKDKFYSLKLRDEKVLAQIMPQQHRYLPQSGCGRPRPSDIK